MTGLEIFDAVMLFFGYTFVAITPLVCFITFDEKIPSKYFGILGTLALLWFAIILATLGSMHDFIFYVGVIG